MYWFFIEKHKTECLIETGTDYGETLNLAINLECYKHYISIECNSAKFELVKYRFKDNPYVKLYLGNSPDILDQIIDPSISTTFWLDAHYQGGTHDDMDQTCGECPLIDELKVIISKKWQEKPVILVDDAEMFFDRYWQESPLAKNFTKSHWPTIEDIESLMAGYDIELVQQQLTVEQLTNRPQNNYTTRMQFNQTNALRIY